MPNIGAILREEIGRLSRRSTRSICVPLKRDVAGLRRAVAALRRENQKLMKDNARLMADLNSRLAALPAMPEEALKKVRISPRLVKVQRTRLGLSRQDFSRLLGVSAGAVLAWEGGRSKPREKAKAALAAVRRLGKREARRRLEVLSPAAKA